ncbi:chloride channel protein [Acidithrix ferrooxidans]|uniref:chloride channel protein n=1 Tax=Acidithrix ferrooxidans TaxID=1280514 RepID=UPI0009E45334
MIVATPFLRIIATSLSIGSGGSGGAFGPGKVISTFTGGAFWSLFHHLVPSMGLSSTPWVIVGMSACFGSIARIPIALMIMVAELTNSISALTPTILTIGIASVIVSHFDATI